MEDNNIQEMQPFEDIPIVEPPEIEPFDTFQGAGVYADLLLDHTFKKAFDPDSPTNKKCLIALLNAVLEGELESPIRDVRSRDKEAKNGSHENRKSVFDLHCVDECNRIFIIEVQIAKQENIINRAIFYAAQDIVSQGEIGTKYRYALDPVITVVFMEFEIFGDRKYLRRARLRESDGTDVSKTLLFAFVELPKFKKSEAELSTTLDRGLFALKNMKRFSQMPESYSGTPFEPLFAVSKLCRLTKKEQEMISAEQKDKWDNLSTHDCAWKEGQAAGLAKGMAKGLAKGRAEGHASGLEEGKALAFHDVARTLLSKGIPLNIVEASTGLSAAELQKLT